MRRLASLIVLVALATAAGCGSDSSAPATDAAGSEEGSLAKGQFIAKADALCAASKAKREPLQAKVEGVARRARDEERGQGTISDGTRTELAGTLGQIATMAETDLSQLEALGFPEAEADKLEAIFQKSESALRASRDYGAALENREDARAQTSAEAGNAETREVAALAEQYGFEVCGSPPQE